MKKHEIKGAIFNLFFYFLFYFLMKFVPNFKTLPPFVICQTMFEVLYNTVYTAIWIFRVVFENQRKRIRTTIRKLESTPTIFFIIQINFYLFFS
jgi:hypothetical protein